MEDALQYRLQYEAPGKLRSLYRSLAFYLQICIFMSGAEGSRTPDLRRAKASWHILACPSTSGDSAILQVISEILGGGTSAVYQLVPARLQYGCSKQYWLLPGSRMRGNERWSQPVNAPPPVRLTP